jgi:hypothetical protein
MYFIVVPYQTAYVSVTNDVISKINIFLVNPLTLELNPSAQRCLTKFFTADFAS